jgi:hypothetical protein
MRSVGRYAVVTPYYKEQRRLLERAMSSVCLQTVPADHLLIADGFPQDWIDAEPVRHFRLDKAHGDYGNTPRGYGAMIAAAEQYDAICFLDADNWLEPDHVEHCLEVAASAADGVCDFVIARRTFRRPDETIMEIADEPIRQHVDTGCFFFLKGTYHLLPVWMLMPRELSILGDRIFWKAVQGNPLFVGVAKRPTVNYHCLWAGMYRSLGEEPPADAKASIDRQPIDTWLASLSDRERQIVERLARVKLPTPMPTPTGCAG